MFIYGGLYEKTFILTTIFTVIINVIDVYAMPVAVNSVLELQNLLTNSAVDGNTLSSKDEGTIFLCNDTSCTAELMIQDSSLLNAGKTNNYRHDNVSLEFAIGQFGGSLIINGVEFSFKNNGNGTITIIKAIIPMGISYDITLNDYLLEGYVYLKDIIEIGRDEYGYISSNQLIYIPVVLMMYMLLKF